MKYLGWHPPLRLGTRPPLPENRFQAGELCANNDAPDCWRAAVGN